MRHPPLMPWQAFAGALMISGALSAPPVFASNSFCGGAATPGNPADLNNVVGDQTLEYAAQQPASIVTCAKGYLLEKCGDHENAHKVFDKCIAAGYLGAMIWKALLLEDGTGVKADLAQAAELMHRVATSNDPAYAPIGKMHYATMLHQGKGVPRDEAAARQWFEAAAAEGSEEARDFLRTGYHTGERDQKALGAGMPPPGALTAGLTGDNASMSATAPPAGNPTVNRKKAPNFKNNQPAKWLGEERILPVERPEALPDTQPPESQEPDSPAPATIGQKLKAVIPTASAMTSQQPLWIVLLLALTAAAGILQQRAKAVRHGASGTQKS